MIVSIALPVYNAEPFLDECFDSIIKQRLSLICNEDCNSSRVRVDQTKIENEKTCASASAVTFEIEVSVYDDGSTDCSAAIIDKWQKRFFSTSGFSLIKSSNETGSPKGVGYGRNQTIRQSTGEYVCFCDADDIMTPDRIGSQLHLCMQNHNSIIGSKFRRIPEDSTRNFTSWANSITQPQLQTQVYLSFGPTIVMPTWFCSRETYERVQNGFSEGGKGVPEDLIFFYAHLDLGGTVVRSEKELVLYRYHPGATTFSVTDEKIHDIRLERLETKLLSQWNKFTIWNAGKLGRRLYRSLKKTSQEKVICFCDIDKKKISQKWYHPYPIKVKVPIVHPNNASPPFIICVKTELTFDANGDFRKLLDSLNLKEGIDYAYFN